MKTWTIPVQVTVDREHDMAYLQLKPHIKGQGDASRTERHEAIFDFNHDGELVGIELLSARGLNE